MFNSDSSPAGDGQSGIGRVLVTGGSGFIGTHLVDLLLNTGYEVFNADINSPKRREHDAYWHRLDVLDHVGLLDIAQDFGPTWVVHLAARTDTEGSTVADYRVNIDGTENVLHVVKICPSVQRVLVTSSQFVVRPGRMPISDTDFDPHTAYGQSKVMAEQLTRDSGLNCIWTIARPTNVWGPWHPRYPTEFWQVLAQGRYLHPGHKPVVRSYGYVVNVVHQMERILQSPASLVDGKVFYLGDPPVDLWNWVSAFSLAIRGAPVRVAPRALLKGLALVGDALKLVGFAPPLYSSRYRSMTTDYPTPMGKTLESLGPGPVSMSDGVEATVDWLRLEGFLPLSDVD